ncbi:DUF413 domain-containing protein [Thalassomonas viridans]|uniref:Macrodomain Ori protein n=1 Tax=Thalassomonas viridans TaxID=137584 RepID=A0AAF0C8T9_9GAMM|nr:DUF413 domain-containing protein [Thalassomonas viridans]WDE05098.1 DUF413 domain-containing protein [Thalassomonas viridans]
MILVHGFVKAGKFYDDVNFPYGFRKSGNFSITEADLLTDVGKRLFMLEQGLAAAQNQVEEKFVEMCRTQREGESKIERLWQKYQRLTKKRSFHTLSSRVTSNTDINTNDNIAIDEEY